MCSAINVYIVDINRTASRRTILWRGFGPGWFSKRFDGNAFVPNLEDPQVVGAAGCVKDDAIARSGLHQRASQWRHPADMVAIQIDLVDADDPHLPLSAGGVGVANRGPEEDVRFGAPASRRFRVDDFRGIDSLRQEANPSIDLAQPPLSVLVVRVLTAIAIARRPRYHLRDRRPFPAEQKLVLVLEPLQAARGDVVPDRGPGGTQAVWLPRK